MTRLDQLKRDWEALAQADPLWAICTDPSKRERGWDVDAFMETGRAEIATVMNHLDSLGVAPRFSGEALDFGCGVGRLTQALAGRFDRCTGVDISPTMVKQAEAMNRFGGRVSYVVNDTDDLSRFESGRFAFVYSSIVLQHVRRRFIARYLGEFARVLEPGGVMVFQIPSHRKVPFGGLRMLLRPRQRLAALKRAIGAAGADVGQRIDMNTMSEASVRRALRGQAELLDVLFTNSCDPAFNGKLILSAVEPVTGFVSKQYVVRKRAS